MQKRTDYSHRSLLDKLDFKRDGRIYLYQDIDQIYALLKLGETFFQGQILEELEKNIDFIHLFAQNSSELREKLPLFRDFIQPNGILWVSWYKKSSKIPTDVDENLIREVAFPIGLVDIKVCSVSEKWSGLKLVIRKELR
jgi:hypothetical protein